MKAWKKIFSLGLAMAVFAGQARGADFPDREPKYLSDLYKYLTHHLEQGLSPNLEARHTIIGRSWNTIKSGLFHRVESDLQEFDYQGLRFLKAHFEFRRLQVSQPELMKWNLKVESLKESLSSMVFSLKSLESKMQKSMKDPSLELRADIARQEIIAKGKGSLALVSAGYTARLKPRWDVDSRKLYLDPIKVEWAGMDTPGWLWWAGDGAWPEEAVLDLSESWIPFNIQEVNLGWDRVSLSTDW